MTQPVSRRSFLTTAAAAAGIPMLFSPANLRALPLVADPDFKYTPDPNAQKIKLGIIGVGGRGTSLLREILKTGQVEVTAICDIRPEAIAQATALCTGMTPAGIAKYQDLLARKDVEAVVIATPVDLHGEMALAAIQSDKHIYCEKPVGINAKETEQFYDRAKTYPKVFQFGFQWMYNANFCSAIAAVHDNVIGGVRYVHAQRHGGDLPRDKGKDWLFQRERSGDIIVEQAVHELNVLCWGLKSHPTRACGLGGTNMYINEPAGRSIMDHYSLTYEFPGPVHVSYSHLYYAGALGGSHIYFYGSKGVIDVMGGQIMMADDSKPEPRQMKLTSEDTFNAFLSFFDKIRTGAKADADPERGYLATKTALLGRQAIYDETMVSWNELQRLGPSVGPSPKIRQRSADTEKPSKND